MPEIHKFREDGKKLEDYESAMKQKNKKYICISYFNKKNKR